MPFDGRRTTLRLPALWLTAGALVVGALGGAFFAHPLHIDLPSIPPATSSLTVSRPMPNVLVAVRDLQRLETASYHMERVIDLRDTQSRLFGLVASEDALLLVAAADVTAGVDLSRVSASDIVVEPTAQRVSIVIPPAEVFQTTLDNAHTYVHTRRTGVLAERKEDLESRARLEAESQLRASAVEGGLLDKARANAAHTIESLLRSLGFAHVTVTTGRTPRAGD